MSVGKRWMCGSFRGKIGLAGNTVMMFVISFSRGGIAGVLFVVKVQPH